MNIFHHILKQYWGYDSFRPLQEDIIQSVADGKDTIGLMPTGGGKSLTFQVPALATEGICIVITPLIALMKDQVNNLKSKGIKAAAIHSGLSRDEINTLLDNCIFGGVKFLYISPERLGTEIFQEKIQQMPVNLLAVDEAHCISQWGYDFRPSYLKIAIIRELLPDTPVLALTATATPEVVDDIQERLLFKEKNLFQKSFKRDNLVYVVRQAEDKEQQLLNIINKVPGSAVVYVRNRKKTQEYAELLIKNGISASSFHAGMPQEAKDLRQKRWTDGEIRVIVSTNAFGMGIDKPDVRLVVHMDAPDSLEAYFQEAGRAGRDGKKAFAVLLWSNNDKVRLKRSISVSFPEKEKILAVYEALGNFLQVAVGSGFGMVYDFNLTLFCKNYRMNLMTVFNSLKLLQRAGYIEFTEELQLSAKVHFIIRRDDLYKFQVANEDFDSFIKLLLRSYTGLFTEYVAINEELLAKRMGVERNTIYQFLVKLSQLRVIKYIPQKKTPLITYTTSREDSKYIELRKEVYKDRKAKYEQRIQSVIEYGTINHICRSKQLLRYFGQQGGENCGMCDVCQSMKKTDLSVQTFDALQEQIIKELSSQPLAFDQLLIKLNAKQEDFSKVLRWLEEYEVVSENQAGLLEIIRIP
ncbi:RecQ family ATP-dependent DNA helicase [Carboxylicivirga sediminis]|uniref:ATP-dependent DNA helicase RecQ n=1 Tax=Carboxylicivirga sediminis TaxID=2006564 RepID=A0A941F8B2_9BACT|nr:ATP-dependent DNA helicase RecQ [Carboxylicivirga sediminis]MBR8537310.1 RecQ family ATP-dependent DNA helicase [Carboxylicivirga sediminis]